MNSAVRDANRHLSWRLRGQGADLITGRVVTAGQQPAWATVVMAAFAPDLRQLLCEKVGRFAELLIFPPQKTP